MKKYFKLPLHVTTDMKNSQVKSYPGKGMVDEASTPPHHEGRPHLLGKEWV